MGRYRIPDNAVFRRSSSRGIERLDYPKAHEWDPQKIGQAVNMVSNINNAATGILGAKPLDLIVSGIARASKDDDPIETGVRRAATARVRAQGDTGQQAQEQPAPAPAPAPAQPQGQEGMDLTSIGSFGEARRYARSGIPGGGIRTFKWNGKLYSTVGYQDEKDQRSEQHALEDEEDWSADLKRSRDRRFYSNGQPVPVPQPAAPEPAPTQKADPVAVASLFEQYNVNPEDGVEKLKEVISARKTIVSTPQKVDVDSAQVSRSILPGSQYDVDAAAIASVSKDQAMLESYTQQQAAQPQQEVVQEEFTEESVDPDVSASQRRQQDRIREMREGRATPQIEVRRRQMTGALEMLRSGSIPMPGQLPSNVEDIASIAMVVTDRRALPNLVRAARDSAMPTSFADLFTGNHERRAAKTVMDSFSKGEGKRTTPMDMSKLIQNEEKLRIARRRLENQDRNVTSQIERRKVQNKLSRVDERLKGIKLNKLLNRGMKKTPEQSKTIDQLLSSRHSDSVAQIQSELADAKISFEVAKDRLSVLSRKFRTNKFRALLKRKGISPGAIRNFYTTLNNPLAIESAKAGASASKVRKYDAQAALHALLGVGRKYDKTFAAQNKNKEWVAKTFTDKAREALELELRTLQTKLEDKSIVDGEREAAQKQASSVASQLKASRSAKAIVEKANNAIREEKKREAALKGK